MIRLTLAELADVVGGDLARPGDGARSVSAVEIDSRRVKEAALFVPLPGERTDGHAFIADAVAAGAAGYLLEAGRDLPAAAGAVVVDDPADALLGLGAWVRDTVDPLVVGVTGSNGKTTTKDLIAAALSTSRRCVASEGSYNNELGVPLTCCRLDRDSDVLVAEVGARGVGHIAALAGILRPDVAVVTTVAGVHLELLGDLDTVARAKRELVEALGPGGVAVLNADDRRVLAMAERAPGRMVTYGRSASADYRAVEVVADARARARFTLVHPAGRVDVQVPLPGEHHVGNALAALAVAAECGVDVETAAERLAGAAVSRWRMEVRSAPGGVTVVNDAYNANPASVEAALRTLVAMDAEGRRWAVLGHMAEIGVSSEAAHDRIGRLCVRLGVDGLVVVGSAARALFAGAGAEGSYGEETLVYAEDPATAAAALSERLAPGDVVLVKASRSAGLERVADALVGPGGGEAA